MYPVSAFRLITSAAFSVSEVAAVSATLGIDLNHFGIVVVGNPMIGLITPPCTTLLVILQAASGIPPSEMIRETRPSVRMMILALMLTTYVPAVSLWLPRWAWLW